MANANDYNRIMRKAWADAPNDAIFNVWPNRAATALKAIWKANMGTKLPYPIKFTSGNRDTWVRKDRKTGKRTLFINPDQGWIEMNHLFSHWVSYRVGNRKPHSEHHIEIERSGAELIQRRGFLTTEPYVEPEKPRVDLVAQRASRIDARIVSWEKKQKRAENALKKLRKQQRYYAKKLAS